MMRLEFAGPWPSWVGIPLAILTAVLVWYWYRRESKGVRRPWSWALPTLRAAAIAMMVLMLTGPTWIRTWLSGEQSRLIVLVDESASMGLTDDGEPTTRLDRVRKFFEGSDTQPGWLARARDVFQIQVLGFSGAETQESSLRSVWNSASDRSKASISVPVQAKGAKTAIGDGLQTAVPWAEGASAVVLLSDGQSNSGEATSLATDAWKSRSLPIYAIGYGRKDEPNDLGVLSVEHPTTLFASDALQGTVTLKQQLPQGTLFRTSIKYLGQPVWQQTFRADGNPTRTVDFRVDGAALERGQPPASNVSGRNYPIDLQFEVAYEGEDASASNDSFASSLWGISKKDRVLILDQRGRWEARYIKNAFQRDRSWDVDAILGPDASSDRSFPTNRESFQNFDVLIMTLESVRDWNDVQLRWLLEHVADTGAGLIWIDSGRDPPISNAFVNEQLLPITMESEATGLTTDQIGLTEIALAERAFSFEADPSDNRRLWHSFPAPRVARKTRASAGAEVLAQGKSASGIEFPLMVTRRVGLGRIVYMAHDESWRWRYNVADLYHQRFWNQVARWSMQMPFAMENDFFALDTGDRTYPLGATIPVRARLRDASQQPMTGARPYIVVERNGVRTDAVLLTESIAGTGVYTGEVAATAAGEVNLVLEVPDVPQESVQLTSTLLVQPEFHVEMDALSQNESLLRSLAEKTGGRYFDEHEVSQLESVLQPLQKGTLETLRWPMWQSFPWFIAILGLLASEWYFRKRVGLM